MIRERLKYHMKRFERIRGPCGRQSGDIDSTGGLNLLKNVGKCFQLGDFGRFSNFITIE